MSTAWAVAIALLCLGAVSLRLLPALHPAQLWLLPWAAAATLFALHLLPYHRLGAESGVLIVGGSVAFAAASALAGGSTRARRPPSGIRLDEDGRRTLRLASVALCGLTAAWLLAFLGQAAENFGVRDSLVSSPEVRTAIGAGQMAVTIKYVYAAIAATMACAMSAACARSAVSRNRWAGAAAAAAFTTYFSTGRSNLLVAVVVGALAYALARPLALRPLRLLAAAAVVAVIAVLVLVGAGSIIGKTFENSELSTIDSVFTQHQSLNQLALPYEYASAPIAAFDQLVRVTPTWGEYDGCATLATPCKVASVAGIDISQPPHVRPFTSTPLEWNTYTGLDAPLMDGGVALAVPILALLGLMAGLVWRWAVAGSPIGVFVYAITGAATVFATGQNRFFDYHFVGAIVLSVAAWMIARQALRWQWRGTEREALG